MGAQGPRMRSGQGRSRRRRWRAAPALTRAQPWTNPKNHSLSGYSGAITECNHTKFELLRWTQKNEPKKYDCDQCYVVDAQSKARLNKCATGGRIMDPLETLISERPHFHMDG